MSSQSSQVWFITGASSGLGRAVTEYVLSKGDNVVATCRTPSALSDLSAQYPTSRLLVLALDVTQPATIYGAFAKAFEAFGRLDVVYNNAGYGILSEIEGTPDEPARAMFEVNFWGALHVTTEAVKYFRDYNKPQGGRLIQVSSNSGVEAMPGLGFYSASKFALEAISESLVAELNPAWNIKITILEPGGFKTKSQSENVVVLPPHPAYGEGTVPHMLREIAPTMQYTGRIDIFVERVYAATRDPNLGLRLPLGAFSTRSVGRKLESLRRDFEAAEKWQENIDEIE
ncbi:NAD(P)-binding protein [Obba rivulosa]|uniref:NAD(P)-binding protein n=1 Tax=Obba rivulosa TaxID=1052685 RepID=A0A8E2AQ46_9APHY|nr:NAD(P)-binding protein [Obba rivulosa]